MTFSSPSNRADAPPAGLMAKAVLDVLNRAERLLDIDPRQARSFIDQASRLLEPVVEFPAVPTNSGLAPWQERKVQRFIDENLAGPINNQDLADVVGLSVSHFGRCFKATFGVSPHGYLIQRRLERAKTLMRETTAPLCEIALDTGFCDQAHMSRLFNAAVGAAPNRWRRAQMMGLAA